jgi:hypothetical protein
LFDCAGSSGQSADATKAEKAWKIFSAMAMNLPGGSHDFHLAGRPFLHCPFAIHQATLEWTIGIEQASKT